MASRGGGWIGGAAAAAAVAASALATGSGPAGAARNGDANPFAVLEVSAEETGSWSSFGRCGCASCGGIFAPALHGSAPALDLPPPDPPARASAP